MVGLFLGGGVLGAVIGALIGNALAPTDFNGLLYPFYGGLIGFLVGGIVLPLLGWLMR